MTVGDDGVGGAVLDDGSGLQGLRGPRRRAGRHARASRARRGRAPRCAPRSRSRSASSRLGFGHRGSRCSPTTQAARAAGPPRAAGCASAPRCWGIAALVIVVVWALTGAPERLAGLAAAGPRADRGAATPGRVLGTPPARRSDLERRAATRAPLRRRRGVRATAGKLAIVNVFLIGIWVAARRGLLLAGLGDARIGAWRSR